MDLFQDFAQYFRFFCEFLGFSGIILSVIFLGLRLLIFCWKRYKSWSFKWCGEPHTWAVITGSTEGIGLSYAKQLAAKGYNLLLISRNEDKLMKVKEQIQDQIKCVRKVRVLAIDFDNNSDEIYNKIEEEFNSLEEIHVLVNNVGTNYPGERPEYLTQIPKLNEVIMSLINVNIVSCTRLTSQVLPRMERRGRGVIINLSSFSALFPVPLLTLYSATKVYVDYMSRALQEEYRTRGIVIQSVTPYYVSTHMTYNMEPRFYAPTPDDFVRQALETVGREDSTGGFYVHRLIGLMYFWLGVYSRFIGIDFNIKLAYRRLKNIRNRIIEKQVYTRSCIRDKVMLKPCFVK
ncbi:very-long-chain 3-oxoacyl-CoA reductase-like [Oppia nitens]|uniref:very-long-chain 3-oxoacyl-CoA reductase-like n=1 Tax=Oppia nitens TaxID=1686743 RepID=UPI0023DCB889|nr:very-long-chain 3-oxoacyl-CoA reductase-like [Oppia nitens]